MTKQSWNLRYGNKGIIFTLDALLALTLLGVMLFASNYFLFKGSEDQSVNLQLLRAGSDIITLLDNTKELDTLNANSIQNSINDLKPEIYEMRINVSWKSAGESELDSFEMGGTVPTDRFVAVGKRFFLVTDEQETNITSYGMIKYLVWLK